MSTLAINRDILGQFWDECKDNLRLDSAYALNGIKGLQHEEKSKLPTLHVFVDSISGDDDSSLVLIYNYHSNIAVSFCLGTKLKYLKSKLEHVWYYYIFCPLLTRATFSTLDWNIIWQIGTYTFLSGTYINIINACFACAIKLHLEITSFKLQLNSLGSRFIIYRGGNDAICQTPPYLLFTFNVLPLN